LSFWRTDFLRTDWPGPAGTDVLHFPGFGVDAATLLVERGVVGLGIDTLGIDPGEVADFSVHRSVTLPRGVWHVENLTNLDRLPAVGAWIVALPMKIADGSGAPVRVVAFVPR